MPFSIKRFTIHRSSSLPAHAPRDKKGEEQQPPQQHPHSNATNPPTTAPPVPPTTGTVGPGGRILKKSASQEERKPKHSSRQRGLSASQSVDTADLRRMGTYAMGPPPDERYLPPVPPHVENLENIYANQPRFQQPLPYIPGVPPPAMDRHPPNMNPRWRSSAKERNRMAAMMMPQQPPMLDHGKINIYDQAPPPPPPIDIRKIPKRNGVKFQDSDLGTEESQSTSSSSGGGGGGGGGSGGPPKVEYWEDPKYSQKDGRWGNGRRGTRMAPSGGSGREWGPEDGVNGGPRVKRSQQRRHQHSAEPAVVQDSRPRTEGEVGHRNPIYTPPQGVYDDDPGIMSEVETSATGFRRGNKGRQALPVVRTPSRTQERPLGPVSPQMRQENLTLGLVFLQYRSETKRALLPNEITTLDTVKALFVRSFPKQLTMEYLDSPHIRIYIHDAAKDMFYELEDLRDIRDRSVLRIYEQDINGEGIYSTWEQDLSYFSEPEFDSEYQNQHIHRKNALAQAGYYGMSGYSSLSRAQTLPPGASMRAFSPLPPEPPRAPKGPPPTLPPVAYAQTLPWGTHIVTYAPGPPSPEKRPKEILIPPSGLMQPPPKPQRSFQQQQQQQQQQQPPPLPPMVKGIRSTPPPTGPPPSIPSPRSAIARPIERRHDSQVPYRPPPERPYSAGPYPDRSLYESSTYHSAPTRPGYESGGGYLSSPEGRYEPQRAFATAYPMPAAAVPASAAYDEPPYYGDRIYASRSGSVAPVVDEEARMRVEYMERQLASLTGLVQKALSTPSPPRLQQQQQQQQQLQQQQQQVPTRDVVYNRERTASEDLYDAKSSKSSSNTSLTEELHEARLESSRHAFKEEKSVSFSDEATSVCNQKQHSPQHAAERPVKPAIKSSPSLRSQSSGEYVDSIPTQLHPPTVKVTTAERAERESRSKPAPPPKPPSLSSGSSCEGRSPYSPPTRPKLRPSTELYSNLRHLKKQTKDLKLEVRNLRRIAQAQALTAKETVRETCLKIKTMLAAAQIGEEHVCAERLKVSREEDLYRQDVNHLEKDLLDLESQVEELRGNVINRKCRVNLGDVEGMALILSRASKAVADLKARFPALQESLKTIMAIEMEVVVREEKFLKDEPQRLENALRRCKKLTGTLVTLKRLASVQEQRHTVGHNLPQKSHSAEGPYSDGEVHSAKSTSFDGHTVIHVPPDGHQRRGETALDALLCELQTFNLPAEQKRDMIPGLLGAQRRLPSYPSADSPVRSPIHGYAPPGSKSPTPDSKSGNTLQVNTGPKSLSPTPQIIVPERRLSPSALEVATRHSPNLKQMVNGPDTGPTSVVVKKVPPPPPPRTTSRSPITSPTAAVTTAGKQAKEVPVRGPSLSHIRSSSVPPVKGSIIQPALRTMASNKPPSREEPIKENEVLLRTCAISEESLPRDQLSSNSSSSESVNSQEGVQMALQAAKLEQSRKLAQQQQQQQQLRDPQSDEVFKRPPIQPRNRQEILELRHQELLRKQRQLQDQYSRLQQMQRGQLFPKGRGDLKKTGSESNILMKAALAMTPASGSMQHLAITSSISNPITGSSTNSSPNSPGNKFLLNNSTSSAHHTTSSKIYETDIL